MYPKKIFSILLLIASIHASNIDLDSHDSSPIPTQGIAIFDLSHNKLLGAQNFNQLFNPASLKKLFTAYTALKLLEPEYSFTTKVATVGELSHSKLLGDLVIEFSGDPTLTNHDLKQLFAQVKLAGINSISGNVIIVGADYDSQNYGPGWMWDELDDCYAAPVSNFIINKNCVTANITRHDNHLAVALTEPLDIPLEHNIYFSKDPLEQCSLTFEPGHSSHYVLSGCIPYNKTADKIDIAIRDPELHIKKVIVKALADHNIAFAHNIIIQKQQPAYHYSNTWEHHSSKLSDIIATMLKKSDNMIAESLYKKLGQIYHNDIGTLENGRTAELAILANSNIALAKNQLQDGSGVSRYNYVTPKQVLTLLRTIKNDQKIFPIIFASLPTAGIDGTMTWLQEPNLCGKIHAKTGYLNNLYNLAGYFADGQNDYAFIIMTTGLLAPIKAQRELAQKTINKLLQQYHVSHLA